MRVYGTSTSAQADTLTTAVVPTRNTYRLLWVSLHYSGSATHSGITVSLTSTTPSATTILATSTANAQDFLWLPDNGDMYLQPGDQVVVSIPNAGSVTGACAINFEVT